MSFTHSFQNVRINRFIFANFLIVSVLAYLVLLNITSGLPGYVIDILLIVEMIHLISSAVITVRAKK